MNPPFTPAPSTSDLFRLLLLPFLLVAAIPSLVPSARADVDTHLIAIGQIDGATGNLVNSADAIGATSITSTRLATGSYNIRIQKPGLLFHLTRNDFLVQVTPKGVETRAIATQVDWGLTTGGRTLHINVRTDNVEDIAYSLDDDPLPEDVSFYFSVFFVPRSFPAGGDTKFLLATGEVDADASLVSGAAVEDIAIETKRARRVAGDYHVNLRKPGAFAGTGPDDFVVLASVHGADTGDTVVRGIVEAVTSDLVSVRLFTLDAQADPMVSWGLAETEDARFSFTILRIPENPATAPVQSRLLEAMGEVQTSGTLVSGGGFGGGSLTASKLAHGAYEIVIDAPGAFVGRSPDDFVVQLQVRGTYSSDVCLNGRVGSLADDRLTLLVNANDVEVFRASEGTPAVVATGESPWRSFNFFLYNTVGEYRADMRVGLPPSPDQHRGDDLYGSPRGQQVQLRLHGTRPARFHFTLQNDGNLTDHLSPRASRAGRHFRTQFFRLSGGRRNLSTALVRGSVVETDVGCGEAVLYQGKTKYRSRTRRPRAKINLFATSAKSAGADRAQVNVRGR